jgi:hypothetical protein
LKIRDADGRPYVLIGGQEVNYWAEHYLSADSQLEKLRPFTSEDIDFKGGHADFQRMIQGVFPECHATSSEHESQRDSPLF